MTAGHNSGAGVPDSPQDCRCCAQHGNCPRRRQRVRLPDQSWAVIANWRKVGGLVEEHAIGASTGFHQPEELKDADRTLAVVQRLSPDLLQLELVEATVKARSHGRTPEPPAPASSLANDEPEFASASFSVEIDVTDEEALVDCPEPD